jgi:AraC family transcriptional regulator
MNKAQKRIEDIVKFIIKSEANVFKELNIKTFAEKYGLNIFYLSRTFKKYKGVNFSEYITRLRMIKSALMLIEKRHLKICEISDLFGWERPDGFINAFKRFFGISPGKFKNLMQ